MVLVRFGRWEAILATPFRDDQTTVYLGHTLFQHFARGVALGATGDLSAARAEQERFRAILGEMAPETRRKHNVNIKEHTAPIAAEVLEAELLYREGEHAACFAALERAACPPPAAVGSWRHVLEQRGMFTYTGLTAAQVVALREKHHVYMPLDGRLCMAALTDESCDFFATALREVLQAPEAGEARALKKPRH